MNEHFPYDPKELMEVPWFEDADGFLYIVGEAEVLGPDNETADSLARGDVPEHLHCIPSHLRRWHPKDGFYHA